MTLDAIQLRVLGALIEKEIATPENYPLSLNALLNACNQRSSRDPVLDLEEDQVRQALHALEDGGLASPTRDTRVTKFEHRARTVFNLRRDETALLCLLLLRGPQTPGELRSRSDRLFSFDDLPAVQSALERLARREDTETATMPLARMLPRQPGSREARYMHLLGGDADPASFVDLSPATVETSSVPVAEATRELARLGRRIDELEARLALLERAQDVR